MGPCRVILIGMMGSGKTTIGRLLSERTGWPYVDNDDLVRRRYGATSRELLASGGRGALREAEKAALHLGLELTPPVIVGVAAGTILDAESRDRMRDAGIVVWLSATAGTLIERAMDAEHRPFLDTAGREWMIEAVADRRPLYESVASLTVDTDADTPAKAVERIRAHLASAGCEEPATG